jgi:isopenicillin-N N-acyltransferase like protein
VTFSPDSLYRAERIERALTRSREAGTGALIREALSDHFGHPTPSATTRTRTIRGGTKNETVASSIVDLTTGEYWIAHGQPCENDYELLPWNLYDGATVQGPLRAAAAV